MTTNDIYLGVFLCSKISPRMKAWMASNQMGAFMVVRAESHEAAAMLFDNHPHFTIFPGASVEIMRVPPIPSA